MTDFVDSPTSDWQRPLPEAGWWRSDLWVAIGLAAATAGSVSLSRAAGVFDESPTWLVITWVILLTVPLAVRRRWPEAAAIIVSLTFSVGAMLGVGDVLFGNICLYLSIYSVGAWGRNRVVALWVRGAIILGMFLWLFWALLDQSNQVNVLPELSREGAFSPYAAFGLLQVLINILYFAAAYYFGNASWNSARRAASLVARTHELAEERERTAHQAVVLERVRIARELHDVVAHHVSMMGVQAGAARRVLGSDPDEAVLAITRIEESARSAVKELHALLGALRDDDDDDPGSPPGSLTTSESISIRGAHQLEQLVAENRAAGLAVKFSVIGEPIAVPATVDACIYRITQEALTNTRKHAGAGATADVRLRYEPHAVELEVTDDGVGAVTRSAAPGGGLGHRGMRERTDAVGGELHLGARSRGGYLVRARFPFDDGASSNNDAVSDEGAASKQNAAPNNTPGSHDGPAANERPVSNNCAAPAFDTPLAEKSSVTP